MAKLQEFQPPQGLKLPEDLQDGGEFDALATFRFKKGGNICLVEIDGNPMPGYKEESGDDDYSESVGKRFDEAMPPNNPGGPISNQQPY